MFFSCLKGHTYETEARQNHLVLLIKAISEKYLQVRYYSAKQFSARILTQKSVKS